MEKRDLGLPPLLFRDRAWHGGERRQPHRELRLILLLRQFRQNETAPVQVGGAGQGPESGR